MLHEERVTYETLKTWALESYYEGCRDHGVMQGWSHEQVMGYVSYTFENGFERVIENLMWRVVLLVLSGGWQPTWEASTRSGITDEIVIHSLEKLLAGLPQEEAKAFKHDLTILKLIPQ